MSKLLDYNHAECPRGIRIYPLRDVSDRKKEIIDYVTGVLNLQFNISGRPYCNNFDVETITVNLDRIMVKITVCPDSHGYSNSFGHTVPVYEEFNEWVDTLHQCTVSTVGNLLNYEKYHILLLEVNPMFRDHYALSPIL